jgi:energy-coupling factor transport system substrate-specific component
MELQLEINQRVSIARSRQVAITAIMTALALVGNYIFVAIPNVELGSGILFVTAYLFGFQTGASCAVLMAIIFGSINPWGGLIPQIWLTQVIGWLYITAAGALMGRDRQGLGYSMRDVLILGFTGAFLTFFFDMLTNLGYSWAFGIPYWLAIVSGFPFMVVHIVSNAIIFGAVASRLDIIVRSQFSSQIWSTETEILGLSEE